jgi:hypothetical protein
MIHRCFRCTEVLPATAVYCRRCGAQQRQVPRTPVPRRKSRPWINVLGFLMLIGMGLALTGYRAVESHPQWQSTPVNAPGEYVPQPMQPRIVFPMVQPMPAMPAYPERERSADHLHDREQWRR